MTRLTRSDLLFQPVTIADADVFYALYAAQYDLNEDPKGFLNRILLLCERLFVIRTVHAPDTVIGDCALHHWRPDIRAVEIGGTLLPEYRGQGIMAIAFELLSDIAIKELSAEILVAKTEATNFRALRFAEKLGFTRIGEENDEITLNKRLMIPDTDPSKQYR